MAVRIAVARRRWPSHAAARLCSDQVGGAPAHDVLADVLRGAKGARQAKLATRALPPPLQPAGDSLGRAQDRFAELAGGQVKRPGGRWGRKKRARQRRREKAASADGGALPPPREFIRAGAEMVTKASRPSALVGLDDAALAAYLLHNHGQRRTQNSADRAARLGWLRRDIRILEGNRCEFGNAATAAVVRLLVGFGNPWAGADRFMQFLEGRAPREVDTKAWLAGIQALVKAERVADVDAVLQQMPRLPRNDVPVLGSTLMALYVKADPDKAKAMFRSLKQQGIANEAALVLCLTVCGPGEAEAAAAAPGVPLTPRVFSALIGACRRGGGVERATELWRQYEGEVRGGADVGCYNAILQVCRLCEDVTALEYWMQRMHDRGVTWDMYTYSTVLNTCAELSRRPGDRLAVMARTLFEHACTSGAAQNVKVCGGLAQLHAKHNDVAGMKKLVDYMDAHAVYVTSVIRGYMAQCGIDRPERPTRAEKSGRAPA
eukprot:TRINITY_DN18765_c0_g1_i1.p1 TRINITY_DN18765_c0_g1~~TRINITY_DN18765_c0_g1_i1.p1  ORF type:complete len:491 (+),score=112.68 TRINITY_DN18765_c0_g1_i1:67-1539(+)